MNAKAIAVVAAVCLIATSVLGGEKKDRFYERGPEVEKLKVDGGLSDADIAKIKEAVAAVNKKNDELLAKPEAKAANEELKKADDARKAAEKKLKEALGGFVLLDEHKKAVYDSVPDDKKAKIAELIHYQLPKKPKGEKAGEAKPEEKKPDAK